MNLVNEGVLPPDELDDRDERRELAEALLTKPADNVNSGAASDSRDNSGNSAKLREALKQIHDLVNSLDENCAVDPVEIRDKARAALAAPPRNCDRPECATVQGADEEFCKAGERDHSLGMCWEDLCYWLLAPAAKQEGGAK